MQALVIMYVKTDLCSKKVARSNNQIEKLI